MFSVFDQGQEVINSAWVVILIEFKNEVTNGFAVFGEGEVDSGI